jgi:hypothetical protein
MALYSFDVGLNTLGALTSNLNTAQTSAANINQLEVYKNNWLTKTNNNNDADTNYDNAMQDINATMPNEVCQWLAASLGPNRKTTVSAAG